MRWGMHGKCELPAVQLPAQLGEMRTADEPLPKSKEKAPLIQSRKELIPCFETLIFGIPPLHLAPATLPLMPWLAPTLIRWLCTTSHP